MTFEDNNCGVSTQSRLRYVDNKFCPMKKKLEKERQEVEEKNQKKSVGKKELKSFS